MTDHAIYLASRSPRRQELLQQAGIAFDEFRLRAAPGRHRDVVEEALDSEPALHYVERIARTKATTGWKRMIERAMPPRPVLGADTEVVLDGVIFGKPAISLDTSSNLMPATSRSWALTLRAWRRSELRLFPAVD